MDHKFVKAVIELAAIVGSSAILSRILVKKDIQQMSADAMDAQANAVVRAAVSDYISESSTRTIEARIKQKVAEFDMDNAARKNIDNYLATHAERIVKQQASPVIESLAKKKINSAIEEKMDEFDYTSAIKRAVREEVTSYVKENANEVIRDETKRYVSDKVDGIGDALLAIKTLKELCE